MSRSIVWREGESRGGRKRSAVGGYSARAHCSALKSVQTAGMAIFLGQTAKRFDLTKKVSSRARAPPLFLSPLSLSPHCAVPVIEPPPPLTPTAPPPPTPTAPPPPTPTASTPKVARRPAAQAVRRPGATPPGAAPPSAAQRLSIQLPPTARRHPSLLRPLVLTDGGHGSRALRACFLGACWEGCYYSTPTPSESAGRQHDDIGGRFFFGRERSGEA
nr:recQ-mediated genome instability protein 1-like [Aegilops tauschii subsp. strangulata]